MSKKKNPNVFLDVSIGGDPVERIVIEVLHHTLHFFHFLHSFLVWLDLLKFFFSPVIGSFLLMLFLRQRKTSVPSAQVP